MPYQIVITDEAEEQLRWLAVYDQRQVESAILLRLAHQPTVETTAINRLRPNPLVQYELRVADLRVLYNVDEGVQEVLIVVIGKKEVNRLIVAGQEFHGHQDHPDP